MIALFIASVLSLGKDAVRNNIIGYLDQYILSRITLELSHKAYHLKSEYLPIKEKTVSAEKYLSEQ